MVTKDEFLANVAAEEPSPGEQLLGAPAAEAIPAEEAPAGEPAGEQEASEPGTNPSWEEAWADVPEPIREQQKAVFDKWDRNTRKVMEQYKPFKELEDQGVTPEQIQQALLIQRTILEDPALAYKQIGEAFNLTPAQAQQVVEQQQRQNDDDPFLDSEGNPQVEDPRITQMLENQRIQNEWIASQQSAAQRQQQEAAEAADVAAVEQELAALRVKYKDIDDIFEERILERGMLAADSGKNPSLELAYLNEKEYRESILGTVKKAPAAPKVLGGGSPVAATPAAEAPKGPKSAADLRRDAMELGLRLSKQLDEAS